MTGSLGMCAAELAVWKTRWVALRTISNVEQKLWVKSTKSDADRTILCGIKYQSQALTVIPK
jgi:hypothetical protein